MLRRYCERQLVGITSMTVKPFFSVGFNAWSIPGSARAKLELAWSRIAHRSFQVGYQQREQWDGHKSALRKSYERNPTDSGEPLVAGNGVRVWSVFGATFMPATSTRSQSEQSGLQPPDAE